ncbi:MAG TPA: aminoglycoside phosphotransferase family protein [Terracidiphilus sp.]|nr:aminoglycoside phosphotransferase family protein [Terracidiphilus sp.]
MTSNYDLAAITATFQIPGPFISGEPWGSGHINDTFRVTTAPNGQTQHAILQRINHRVFRDPVLLMRNVERVTSHLLAKVADQPDAARRVVALIPTHSGNAYHVDAEGNTWRAYTFISGSHSYDQVESADQAFQAARAFGQFQQFLADLPAPPLGETIPNFHHTPTRFQQFQQALAADTANRAAQCRAEINFALAREPFASAFIRAGLPSRVTHNDTKLNNVLFDETTGQALCVIDLDTVMPGLAAYDFGDLVRTSTSPAAEDERDLSRVTFQLPLFEALARGYLSTATFLTRDERELLPTGGILITFETGLRFLADHLNGDTYFKIHRENHNLDRARTQFRLVAEMESELPAMEGFIASLG